MKSLMQNLGKYALLLFTTIPILSTIVRTAWVIPGRIFGFYSPAHYANFIGFVGWRDVFGVYLSLRTWWESLGVGARASAKWASTLETMYHVFRPGDILVGRLQIFGIPFFQPVSVSGKTGRHQTVVASVGAGKTTYLLTLLDLHKGNAFVIDCDAQMYNAISLRVGAGGNGIIGKAKKVLALDPFKLSNAAKSASWNPIGEIDAAIARHGKDAAVDIAKTLASALIKSLDNRNEWVYNGSRNFLTSLILYVWAYESSECRNLVRVRELLTMGLRGLEDGQYDAFDVLLYEMKQKDDFGGIIAKGAAMMEASQRGTGENPIRSDAIEQTSWLDLPQMQEICKTSDFKCEDLKIGNTSLFIIAPVTDIQGKLSGFVRALTMMSFEAFQKITERPREQCLFVIDEMPSLGRIEIFSTAAAVFRKYSIRLVTVTQNLERLKATYPDTWSGFLGDSECTVWLANDHKDTLEYLSNILGTTTRTEVVKLNLWRRFFLKQKPHVQQVERPLIYPHQLREFLGQNVVVTRNGKRPMRLKAVPYFIELPVWSYEADSFHGEKPLRALTRRFCCWIETNTPKLLGWAESKETALERHINHAVDKYKDKFSIRTAAIFTAAAVMLVIAISATAYLLSL